MWEEVKGDELKARFGLRREERHRVRTISVKKEKDANYKQDPTLEEKKEVGLGG